MKAKFECLDIEYYIVIYNIINDKMHFAHDRINKCDITIDKQMFIDSIHNCQSTDECDIIISINKL